MNPVTTAQYLFLLLCAATSAQLTFYAWQRPSVAGSRWFALTMASVSVWALAYVLEMGDGHWQVGWYVLRFVALALVPVTWLLFTLALTGRAVGKRPLYIFLPFLLTCALAFSNPLHHLVWRQITPTTAHQVVQVVYGPWQIAYPVISYLYFAVSLFWLLHQWREEYGALYRRQTVAIWLGILLPAVAYLVFLLRLTPFDPTPLAFSLVNLLLLLRIATNLHPLDITPIAHRLLIESMVEGVLVLNWQNRVVALNHAAANMAQRPAAEMLGQPIETAWPILGQKLQNNGQERVEFSRDGEPPTYYEASLSPVSNGQHETYGRLLLVRDITAQKEREFMQQDLTRSLVHDLRAPISNSLFALEMLKTAVADFVSPDDLMLLEMTHTNTEKTLQLVNQILDIHRLEAGRLPLCFARVSLAEVVARVVAAEHGRLTQKALRVVQDIPVHLPPAWTDPSLLERILQNLLDNAIKYSPYGESIHLSARLEEANGSNPRRLLLTVADAGPGILPELQARLFEKYTTGEDAGSGSGLGLPFCQMALAAQGQQIWLESTPGKGTTFTFSLAPTTD